MNRNSMAPLRPLIIVFILLNAFFVIGKDLMTRWKIDQSVVIIGNLILFVVTLIAFLLSRSSLKSPNPNVFVSLRYTNFMLKLFVCAGAALIYLSYAVKHINKPGLFVCMGLYVLYTVIEVASLTKLLRKRKNA